MDRDRGQQQLTSSFGAAPNDGSCSFSSPANSLRCSTPSSLSDGKLSTSTEKCLPVTLLYNYNKNGNNVLFLEAGKDFVDVLLSFLTLPMGGIIRLLHGSGDGEGEWTTGVFGLNEAIFKLFHSVEKMEDDKFCISKTYLLDPQEASGFGSKLLQQRQANPEQQEPGASSSGDCGSPKYYSCGMVPHCVCITKKLGRRCPRHGRKMQTPCKFVERKSEKPRSGSRGEGKAGETTGYVKALRYFITDNLEVYPGSESLALLQRLKVERMSMLSSLDLFVGLEEVQALTRTFSSSDFSFSLTACTLRLCPFFCYSKVQCTIFRWQRMAKDGLAALPPFCTFLYCTALYILHS